MKAMILAAGRGERMRPLTDTLPKPLLQVAGKTLIEYHIEALHKAGINELVINHAWLGNKIEQYLGNGHRFGVQIHYSREAEALETAGGIRQALPLLGNKPFIVVNGDVFTDYDYTHLTEFKLNSPAHLVLVNNPEHNQQGDFYLQDNRVYDKVKTPEPVKRFTFSGIGLYQPEFFAPLKPGKQALAPLLRKAMAQQQVSGEFYPGLWLDIGTPQRLEALNQSLNK